MKPPKIPEGITAALLAQHAQLPVPVVEGLLMEVAQQSYRYEWKILGRPATFAEALTPSGYAQMVVAEGIKRNIIVLLKWEGPLTPNSDSGFLLAGNGQAKAAG
jgi:hypothetical protein